MTATPVAGLRGAEASARTALKEPKHLTRALDSLELLRDCEAHSSVILTAADSGTYSKLGLRLTCTPRYQSNQLYHK